MKKERKNDRFDDFYIRPPAVTEPMPACNRKYLVIKVVVPIKDNDLEEREGRDSRKCGPEMVHETHV